MIEEPRPVATQDRSCLAGRREAHGMGRARSAVLRTPGVGPLTALALVALYHRGELVSAEAFIAFMGMEVRVRESGRWRGWVCFALLKNGTEFNPVLRLKACAST